MTTIISVTLLAQEIPEIRGQLNKLVAFADNPDEQRSVRDHETTRAVFTRLRLQTGDLPPLPSTGTVLGTLRWKRDTLEVQHADGTQRSDCHESARY